MSTRWRQPGILRHRVSAVGGRARRAIQDPKLWDTARHDQQLPVLRPVRGRRVGLEGDHPDPMGLVSRTPLQAHRCFRRSVDLGPLAVLPRNSARSEGRGTRASPQRRQSAHWARLTLLADRRSRTGLVLLCRRCARRPQPVVAGDAGPHQIPAQAVLAAAAGRACGRCRSVRPERGSVRDHGAGAGRLARHVTGGKSADRQRDSGGDPDGWFGLRPDRRRRDRDHAAGPISGCGCTGDDRDHGNDRDLARQHDHRRRVGDHDRLHRRGAWCGCCGDGKAGRCADHRVQHSSERPRRGRAHQAASGRERGPLRAPVPNAGFGPRHGVGAIRSATRTDTHGERGIHSR
jgi:hypothetical protein